MSSSAAADTLEFQSFSTSGNGTIQSDLPTGRISPSASPNAQRASLAQAADLYSTGASIGNSINGATKSGGILSLDYYTGYFDVDTVTVLTRCYKTLIPKEDYVAEVLAGVPDLYGPFWVPTTLIFSLFLTSSLISSVTAYISGEPYAYDFTRLGAAVSLVYTYALGLPLLLWAALKYWAHVDDRSPVEMISLYGYSSTVWIVVSWLALFLTRVPPIPFLLLALSTLLSAAFLLRNLYPVISLSSNTSSKLLIPVIAGLHLIMGLALWWGFMAGGGVGAIHDGTIDKGTGLGTGIGGLDGVVGGVAGGVKEGVTRLLRL
ncbi:Yip1 domain family [Pseudohyphozyma bogoriensis]|nr:Yip1 domain family [Pseudohyphozyma bogoriensis]